MADAAGSVGNLGVMVRKYAERRWHPLSRWPVPLLTGVEIHPDVLAAAECSIQPQTSSGRHSATAGGGNGRP
jgi:hypothetical protein